MNRLALIFVQVGNGLQSKYNGLFLIIFNKSSADKTWPPCVKGIAYRNKKIGSYSHFQVSHLHTYEKVSQGA